MDNILNNRNYSEWRIDQAVAFSIECLDSRFCPGYALKNPDLVSTLTKLQINMEDQLDRFDEINNFSKKISSQKKKPSINVAEKLKIPSNVPQTKTRMYEMTFSILKEHFGSRCFTASEAYDVIRPIRTAIFNFKNEKSFRGTILRELQVLKKKDMLEFVDNNGTCRGTYRIK